MIKPEGWSANILVMSFGWDSHEASSKFPLFYQALENNIMPHSPRIVFAAASNGGANYPRTYPATSGSVFAIHATDYNGDAPTPNFNPTKAPDSMSYSTIGHQVPGDSDLDHLRVSGTSFAAPVAAGIAAAVIEFFRQRDVGTQWGNYLRTYDGMRKVFNKMAVNRGDYHYLDWASFFHPGRTPEQIHNEILGALKQSN
jgi:subtilisin family serine protease